MDINQLNQQIQDLAVQISALKAGYSIPPEVIEAIKNRLGISTGSGLSVSLGGTGTNTLTGILKGNGTSAITTVTPLAGTKTCFVSLTSGGAVTTQLTFTDGILTGGL